MNNQPSALFSEKRNFSMLRGISILMTIGFHFSLFPSLFALAGLGYPFRNGMPLFFIISGYGLTMSLLTHEQGPLQYTVKRVLKIYPELFALLTAVLILNILSANAGLSEFMAELYIRPDMVLLKDCIHVLLGTFVLSNSSSYALSSVWFLSPTMWFYLFCLALLIVFRLTRATPIARLLMFRVFSAVGVIISMLVRLCILFRIESVWTELSVVTFFITWKADFILVGVLLAAFASPIDHLLARLYSCQHIGLVEAGLLIVPGIGMAFCESDLIEAVDAPYLTGAVYPLCAVCGIVLIALARKTALPGAGSRILRYIGDRSYQLFLWNFASMEIAWFFIARFMPGTFDSPWSYGIVQILVTAPLMVISCELSNSLIAEPYSALSKKIVAALVTGNRS